MPGSPSARPGSGWPASTPSSRRTSRACRWCSSSGGRRRTARPSRRSTASTPTPTCPRSSTTRSSTPRSSCSPRSRWHSSWSTAAGEVLAGHGHPRRARGLHPVLGALLAAHLRPLREVQHPAGGHGLVGADLPAPRHEFARHEPGRSARPRDRAGPGRLRARLFHLRRGGGAFARERGGLRPEGHRLRGGARPERRPRGGHGRGQDLDHQPPHPLLRRPAGARDARRRRRPRPRPRRAAPRRSPSCSRTSTSSAAPSPPTSGSAPTSRTSGYGRRRGPSTRTASSRPFPRASTRK